MPTPTILDVVEQVKKAPIHVSLWDLLSILKKKNWLKEALFEGRRDASEGATKAPWTNETGFQPATDKSCSPVVLTNEVSPPKSQLEGKPQPNPFYLTLIVGDKLLHNSMIDYGASTTVMPKQITELLNIKYEPLNRGVMQLNGNKVHTIGLIRSLPLTLSHVPVLLYPKK